MSKFVFVYKDIYMGGASLLIHRMSKWYYEHGNDVVVLYCRIQKSMELTFLRDDIKLVNCNNWTKSGLLNHVKKISGRSVTTRVISFTFEEFLWLESEKKITKSDKNIENLLYVVHPRILLRIESIHNKYIYKILWKYYQKLIFSYITNGNIVFMDEETIETTKSFYKIKIEKNDLIYRLPIYINEFDEMSVKNKAKKISKEFNILTIARADFPFKGYIIGLITQFSTFQKNNKNASLTIISSGKDESKIKSHIMQQCDHVRRKIKLVGEVEHNQLSKYFCRAQVFIGMGTSILDAANNSVVPIPVLFDTYNAKASVFFHQCPEAITATAENAIDIYDFLVEIIRMQQEDYYNLCQSSHLKLKEYYGIDDILYKLQMRDISSNKSVMKISHKLIEDIMYVYRLLRRKYYKDDK